MLKLQFADNETRSVWLVGEILGLGSHKNNDLILNEVGIEPFHAQILIKDEQLRFVSENGQCFINEQLVDGEAPLACGDRLRIGAQTLLVVDPKQQLEKQPRVQAVVKPVKELIWQLQALSPQLHGQRFDICSVALLGRSDECDISLSVKSLSRRHAKLSIEAGKLLLQDLQSSNGTEVNGQRVEKKVLADGDIVSFAGMKFAVVAPSDDADDKTLIRSVEVPETVARVVEKKPNQPARRSVRKNRPATVAPEITNPQRPTKSGVSPWVFVVGGMALITVAGWALLLK